MNRPQNNQVTTNEGRTLLTTAQLAKRWGLSMGTLENWRCSNKGPAFVRLAGVRGPVRYRLSDVIAYEESRLKAGEIQ